MADEEEWPDVQVPGGRPRVEHAAPEPRPPADETPWDRHPKTFRVNGREMELFDARALARAVGRDLSTIYQWERKDLIPVTNIRTPRRMKTIITKDGVPVEMIGRRLYPRRFIEGCSNIVDDLGLRESLGRFEAFPEEFRERVFDLWEECYPR